MSRLALSLALGLVGIAALGSSGLADKREIPRPREKTWPRIVYPSDRSVRVAQRYAAGWGDVSFAVIDRAGGARGYALDRHYSAASASKALLLAAELRRLRDEGEPLDRGTRSLLEPMVTYSDNRAADAIYARVGDAGLERVADRAGMRDFEVTPGYWGGAQITAADLARFFWRLERNLVGRERRYAVDLLARITSSERWGIPAATGRGWRVWFKGGWRPPGEEENSGPVTHQGALLEHRSGQRLALAVLSDEPPGAGGFTAIEGVTARLLEEPPAAHRWQVP